MASNIQEKYIRILKGELGPNASLENASARAKEIHERVNEIDNPNVFPTLREPEQDYELNNEQYSLFKQAYESIDAEDSDEGVGGGLFD